MTVRRMRFRAEYVRLQRHTHTLNM